MVTSVHTSDIQKHPLPPRIRIKHDPKDNHALDEVHVESNNDGQLYIHDDDEQFHLPDYDAISDRDEINGKEHEDAVKSPLKGSGVRLGSEVSYREVLI